MGKTFICPIKIDNSMVTVSCALAGKQQEQSIRVKANDVIVWTRGDGNVQTFTLKFFQGETKSVACSAPPFKSTTGTTVDSNYFAGAVTKDCGRKTAYSVDVTKPDGTVVMLDPIIIIERWYQFDAIQLEEAFSDPLVQTTLAAVAVIALLVGRWLAPRQIGRHP